MHTLFGITLVLYLLKLSAGKEITNDGTTFLRNILDKLYSNKLCAVAGPILVCSIAHFVQY